MRFISEIRFALKPSGDMSNEDARLAHTTRAVFAIIGLSLILSTLAVLFLDLTAESPAIWPIFLLFDLLAIHMAVWYFIQKGYWRIARFFPPAIFLVSGIFLTTQPELILLAVMQFVFVIVLTANLFSATFQWVAVFVCGTAFILATQLFIPETSYIFSSMRYIVILLFGAIAILLQISSGIITYAINGLKEETEVRKKSEETALQNEKLLAVVAQSAHILVDASDWKERIYEVLQLLGENVQASHAYLFENHLDKNDVEVSSLRYEWSNPAHYASSHFEDFQNVPLFDESMPNWYLLLKEGKPYYDTTLDFPEEWISKESHNKIKTLLDVPIFVDGVWWGTIGFDDCTRLKPWSQVEVDAMQIAAGLLGTVIKKQIANETIKISEDKFQKTFHETLIPMIIGRLSDRSIIDVNLAFANLSGFTREETLFKNSTKLNLWINQEEKQRHYELLAKQGFLREFKCHLRKKNGDVSIILLSTASIQINNEACILYTLSEITELENVLNELQSKNEELERFTYTVSHDLKAPLITIGGFAGLLKRDIEQSNIQKVNASLERIIFAVSKMERLLNELLELSRIGRILNEPQAVKFEELVKEATSLVQGSLRVNNIMVEIEAGLPSVKVDRTRIIEVLQNLLENSSKFFGVQKNKKIKIGARKDDEGWVFFVNDNGMGIEPVYHERVFGLFNKLDINTEGTGVGLALVKRIIEFHGGRIWVESQGLNTGSTFCFTLPVM
jgi:PAS domain S-box-containing protein